MCIEFMDLTMKVNKLTDERIEDRGLLRHDRNAMKDDGNINWDPTKSVTVPIFYFILAAAAVLTYFFGWWVLAIFVSFWAVAWLFAYLDDKRYAGNWSPSSPTADATPGTPDSCSDAQGNCVKCGGKMFHVVVGVTSEQEIIEFASSAEGWRENPEALTGWMPPGAYCQQGCVAIHVTPIPSFATGSRNLALGEKLDQFEDLLALAQKIGKSDDVYAKQKTFAAYFRRGPRRFVATMLLRHRYQCEICKKELGEAELYFEDPTQPVDSAEPRLDWGEPAGRFYATRRSILHGILAHDQPVPAELTELCNGISG